MADEKKPEGKEEKPAPKDNLVVTKHTVRIGGKDRLGVNEYAEYDPLLTTVTGPYTAGFYDYIRRELKFESDLLYEILSEFVHPKSYAEFENQYVNVGRPCARR